MHGWKSHSSSEPRRTSCFLLGRSAGAYLALTTASRLTKSITPSTKPAGILSFYGYHTFDIPEFQKISPAYAKLPKIPERIVTQLTHGSYPAAAESYQQHVTGDFKETNRQLLTEDPKETRYSIYIYARQTGRWPEFLGSPEDISHCSLTAEDLVQLPPAFFTASTGDQDVPFCTSKYMASKVPGSVFKPVYYLEHDFDRNVKRKEGIQIYEAAICWMDRLLSM